MAGEIIDWEAVYEGTGIFPGEPPWNIGEPQPELAALIEGKVRSDVLDAGCGVAEMGLALAAQGFTVVGIDLSQRAVDAATKAAGERGLTTATFAQGDVTALSGYDGRFNTIIDSTLFHSLPVELRDDYLRSVHRAAASGARYFGLIFAVGAFPPGSEGQPNVVTEDELRAAFGEYWVIDEIKPGFIHSDADRLPGYPVDDPPHGVDKKGRVQMPAWLLSAHKA